MRVRTIFLLIFLSTIVYCQNPVVSGGGILHRLPDFPHTFIAPRPIDVWLPEQYSPKKRYAVLYMHDGQMLFDSAQTWNKQEWKVDETLQTLMNDNKIRDCIVVGVHNTKTRHSDFFPQKPFETLPEFFRDSLLQLARRNPSTPLFNGAVIQSDAYLKFLVQQLKPYIDSHFSTLPDRENTFIAGSSMGGLISIYALCEYPTVFGGAACLSTHWIGIMPTENNPVPEVFLKYLSTHLPKASPRPKIYFDHGTATLDAYYPSHQQRVDSLMLSKGFSADNWLTRVFEGEDHSEKAWAKRLHIPLEFLLKK
jgi:enterochelin esterase-like enzyme